MSASANVDPWPSNNGGGGGGGGGCGSFACGGRSGGGGGGCGRGCGWKKKREAVEKLIDKYQNN